jgi:hypothetical protein
MKSSRFFLLLVPLLLAGCGLSPQQKADYAAVESRGVSSAIYDKMVHGDDLGIHDVEALSQAGVNSGIILRYIRDHGTIYYLSASDVKSMQKADVDSSIIDYMLQTARGGWWGAGPYPYFNGGYDPYFYGDPYFFGPGFYGGYIRFGGGYHGGGHHH